METVSGLVLSAFDGVGTWHYVVVTLIEEMLELLGLALAVGAVAGLHVWRRSPGGLQVRFRGWAERPDRDAAGRVADRVSSGPPRE